VTTERDLSGAIVQVCVSSGDADVEPPPAGELSDMVDQFLSARERLLELFVDVHLQVFVPVLFQWDLELLLVLRFRFVTYWGYFTLPNAFKSLQGDLWSLHQQTILSRWGDVLANLADPTSLHLFLPLSPEVVLLPGYCVFVGDEQARLVGCLEGNLLHLH